MIANKRIISVNIFFSLAQIVITGVAYYFLYKYLLHSLGPELMGVWALVLSISSTANIANLGIGSGVVRFTAKFKGDNEVEKIDKLLYTSLIFLASVFFAIISLVYIIAPYWVNAVLDKRFYAHGMSIVPYSLLCLFLNALNSIYASCIDGLQKNYLRSIIVISSFLILLLSTFLLVPHYGLLGVAYAQLLQSIFLLVGMVGGLKYVFPQHRIFAFKWDRAIFRNIFSFGIKEQIISICQLCFDPLTKSLLGHLGSLSMVTYYEMANRLVLQLRGLLVNANQVLIPTFTNAYDKSSEITRGLYKQVFSLNFLLSIVWLSFIVAVVVPVSLIWTGEVNRSFVIITIFLAVAYFLNIIMSPAYFANLGSALLRNNVISNIIMAVSNVLLGYILGYYFRGFGVVAGWCIALSVGSVYVLFTYHKRNGLTFGDLFKRPETLTTLSSVGFGTFCILLFLNKSHINVWLMFTIAGVLFMMTCLVIFRIHPGGKKLAGFIKRKENI